MHDRILRFRRPNLTFLSARLFLCAMSYFRFDQTERSQGIDPHENNHQKQRDAFKESDHVTWKSEHRNNQESEDQWQKSLQSLCAGENQNRPRMFEIFQGGLSQSPTAHPLDSNNQINQNADRQGHRQFPFPARLV